ncbi:hypothetical protein [Anabaena sp. CCY 9402-a]|uniref:hypothetical protein n=1 Tax=Anabaena sp. CCY 9402-a TaxID=3103867 RepID=UPI0039C6D4E1
MANITIDEIYATGHDLFQDSETFLDKLTNQTIELIAGGGYSSGFGFGTYSGSYSQASYNSFPRSYYSGGYGYGYGYGHGKWF